MLPISRLLAGEVRAFDSPFISCRQVHTQEIDRTCPPDLFVRDRCFLLRARARCGDQPVALAICLSENASSFGTISRLNHASSRLSRMFARPVAIAVVDATTSRGPSSELMRMRGRSESRE